MSQWPGCSGGSHGAGLSVVSLRIYLFLFGCAGSSLPCRLLSSFGAQASLCSGFCCCGARALGRAGFSSCCSRAPEHRLNSSGSQASLLCGRWDLPGPGIELVSPALAGELFTTEPPGKPRTLHFETRYLYSDGWKSNFWW